MGKEYDFCGWASVNDLKCADGRTIRKNAFADQDGATVPLVWMHNHKNLENVIGHAVLENRDKGMFMYGYLNDSEMGRGAKLRIDHRDINSLSIWANELVQRGGDVIHGDIKEVSLVVAGANPGAHIEFPILAHGAEAETEAIIFTNETIITHSDEEGEHLEHASEKSPKEIFDAMSDEQKEAAAQYINAAIEKAKGNAVDKDSLSHSTEVFNAMTDEQKETVAYYIGAAIENVESEPSSNSDELKHSYEGDNNMNWNLFDQQQKAPRQVISQDDVKQIFKNAQRIGSLREAIKFDFENDGVLAHAVYNHDGEGGTPGTEQTYGIADIDWLFPEAKNLNVPPEFIKRKTDWVSVVMDGVHHIPFSRIKSTFADITMEEARAKGYIKGHKKEAEVFSLIRRTTDPQTVYKLQKMDRDDIIDITDFDVVRWIKGEMRLMLDEELARAFLIGDGRLPDAEYKIQEQHIRPVLTDSDDLFVVRKVMKAETDMTKRAKLFIDTYIRSHKDYRGSGNQVMFTSEDLLTDILLMEDGIGHKLYKSAAEVATMLRVSKIVTVPLFEGLQNNGNDVLAISLNLNDYSVGADKGGAVSTFDDFDIEYNKYRYLIETRCSGALTKPFSAIVIEQTPANSSTNDDEVTGGEG